MLHLFIPGGGGFNLMGRGVWKKLSSVDGNLILWVVGLKGYLISWVVRVKQKCLQRTSFFFLE